MTLRTLGLSAALALACASAAAAQAPAALAVRDNALNPRQIAGQADASGQFHYRDVMEGLSASGMPAPWLVDPATGRGAVDVGSAPLPPGAATDAMVASVAQRVAPVTGVTPMTIGQAYAAQRGLLMVCTTSGLVSVIFGDASGVTFGVYGDSTAPITQLGWGVTKVTSSTATCTFYQTK